LQSAAVKQAPPASISVASCPREGAPPCAPAPVPPGPSGSRASPPPPVHPPSATASGSATVSASATPALVILEPTALDMLRPASGISAFGRPRAALKPACRGCERAYACALDCQGVEILTSSYSAIVLGP
jgi:hypothetical protein